LRTSPGGGAVDLTSWQANRGASLIAATAARRTVYSYNPATDTISASDASLAAGQSQYSTPTPRPVGTTLSSVDGDQFASTPHTLAEGLTYTWSEGQSKTSTTVTKYEKNSFNLFGFDWDALVADNSYKYKTTVYTDGTPLLAGEALQAATPETSATN
jgi:hypothetical protein